jgi:hypothetical protein
MNGDNQGINLGDVDPSWMDDGLGVIGEQSEPDFSNDTQWDTTATSDDQQEQDFTSVAGGGLTVQTGPFSGGYTGTVDGVVTITLDERYFLIQDNGGGEVLVSLNTTTCP